MGRARVDEHPLEFHRASRAVHAHPCVDLAHVGGHRVPPYERTRYMHVTVGRTTRIAHERTVLEPDATYAIADDSLDRGLPCREVRPSLSLIASDTVKRPWRVSHSPWGGSSAFSPSSSLSRRWPRLDREADPFRPRPRADIMNCGRHHGVTFYRCGSETSASFTWWRNAKSKSPKSFAGAEGAGGSSSHSRVLFGVAGDTLVHEAA